MEKVFFKLLSIQSWRRDLAWVHFISISTLPSTLILPQLLKPFI